MEGPKTVSDGFAREYEHSLEVLRYVRAHNLVDLSVARQMSPQAIEGLVSIHKRNRKRKGITWAVVAGGLLVLLTVGVYVVTQRSNPRMAPMEDLVQGIRKHSGIQSQEEKDVEARMNKLMQESLPSDEDMFSGPYSSR